MRSSQEDIELLDLYIKGELESSQLKVLETRLSNEQDLMNDLVEMKVFLQGMRADALENKMKMMKVWEEEIVNAKKPASRNLWIWIIIFCAVLGYLLYHFTLIKKSEIPDEYKKLYASHFDRELILHSTKRSITYTDTLSKEQRRAYELYSLQLFDDAIPLLEDLWNDQKDTLSLFYLGVSYVGMGSVDKGLKILNKPELNKYSKQKQLFYHFQSKRYKSMRKD